MSLEDQITRLTNVISMRQEGTAVAEIIRQRDAAQAWAKKCEADAKFYCTQRDNHYDSRQRAERQAAALRGVITRMKKSK
jgi:hypothetical protein